MQKNTQNNELQEEIKKGWIAKFSVLNTAFSCNLQSRVLFYVTEDKKQVLEMSMSLILCMLSYYEQHTRLYIPPFVCPNSLRQNSQTARSSS